MAEWFYMSGGQQQGPVNGTQLKALASNGELAPDDLVWNQTMPEWVVAKRVRGLPFPQAARPAKVHVPVTVPESEQPAESYESEQPQSSSEYEQPASSHAQDRVDTAPAGAPGMAAEVAHLFGKSRGSVALIAFLMFLLMLTSLTIAAVAALAAYDKQQKILTPALLTKANSLHAPMSQHALISSGAYAFLTLIMTILLARYSGKIKNFRVSGGSAELEAALRTQSKVWHFAVLVLLASIALPVLGYLHYVLQRI